MVVEIHEGMSGTHGLRENPLMVILHEEDIELPVLRESLDREICDHALVLQYGDPELLLLEKPLDAIRFSYGGYIWA